MILTDDRIPAEAFERATGWGLKPEGACKGELCVPLPDGVAGNGTVDVAAVAGRLGMPIVTDSDTGMRAVGPESIRGRALTTAVAPELVLPDLAGTPFRLSSLRGQKVLIVAWAPY